MQGTGGGERMSKYYFHPVTGEKVIIKDSSECIFNYYFLPCYWMEIILTHSFTSSCSLHCVAQSQAVSIQSHCTLGRFILPPHSNPSL